MCKGFAPPAEDLRFNESCYAFLSVCAVGKALLFEFFSEVN